MLDVNEATTQSNGHQATPVRGGDLLQSVVGGAARESNYREPDRDR